MSEKSSVKKISTKTICGDYQKIRESLIAEKVSSNGKIVTRDLFALYGTMSGYEEGQSDKGIFTKLLGDFEAVNILTGEIFTSFQAFLPVDVTGFLKAAIKQTPNAIINFSVIVGMRLTETTIGFEYYVKQVIPLAANTAVNKLRDETRKVLPQSTLKMLEGSKDESETEPKKKK